MTDPHDPHKKEDDHHDDHGHDDHGHDDHHDDHGHSDHGHDDHHDDHGHGGHGHDDHHSHATQSLEDKLHGHDDHGHAAHKPHTPTQPGSSRLERILNHTLEIAGTAALGIGLGGGLANYLATAASYVAAHSVFEKPTLGSIAKEIKVGGFMTPVVYTALTQVLPALKSVIAPYVSTYIASTATYLGAFTTSAAAMFLGPAPIIIGSYLAFDYISKGVVKYAHDFILNPVKQTYNTVKEVFSKYTKVFTSALPVYPGFALMDTLLKPSQLVLGAAAGRFFFRALVALGLKKDDKKEAKDNHQYGHQPALGGAH